MVVGSLCFPLQESHHVLETHAHCTVHKACQPFLGRAAGVWGETKTKHRGTPHCFFFFLFSFVTAPVPPNPPPTMRFATLVLLLAASAALASAQTDGGAALVARKSVSPSPAVVGSAATITVEVFNAGST